jgi:hypothetical protein
MEKIMRKAISRPKPHNTLRSKMCYPCHWAKLLPMSRTGQGLLGDPRGEPEQRAMGGHALRT